MPGSGLPLVTMICETNPAGQEMRLRKSFVGITDKQKARITRFRAFSCLIIGDPPRGRTENLLIKSCLKSMLTRAVLCCQIHPLNLKTQFGILRHAADVHILCTLSYLIWVSPESIDP